MEARRCMLHSQGPERSDSDDDGGALDAEAVRELHFWRRLCAQGQRQRGCQWGQPQAPPQDGEPDPERRRPQRKEARMPDLGMMLVMILRLGPTALRFDLSWYWACTGQLFLHGLLHRFVAALWESQGMQAGSQCMPPALLGRRMCALCVAGDGGGDGQEQGGALGQAAAARRGPGRDRRAGRPVRRARAAGRPGGPGTGSPEGFWGCWEV